MILPTFAVTFAVLLVACDAGFTHTVATFMKGRNGADAHGAFARKPDGFIRKAAAGASPDTTTYTSAGWLVQSFYSDDNCGSPSGAKGYAAGICYVDNGQGYKYQLVGDSCTGAVIQNFSDADCTTPTTTTELDAPTGCASQSATESIRATCTSSSTPSLPFQAAVKTYYREADCESVGSLLAWPTYTCFGQGQYQCAGSSVVVMEYDAVNCAGTPTTTTVDSSTCFADDDDVDNDPTYYNPGQDATTLHFECMGSNDATSLASSLGAKAVLAIVLGAVAFLSM